MKTGTERTCEVATCGLLAGTSGAGQVDLVSSDLRLLAGAREEPQEQNLLVWKWNIQEQQAVVR